MSLRCLFRTDWEQDMIRRKHSKKKAKPSSQYDYEVHILFDDAFETKFNEDTNQYERVVNKYVKGLATAIDNAAKWVLYFRRNDIQVTFSSLQASCLKQGNPYWVYLSVTLRHTADNSSGKQSPTSQFLFISKIRPKFETENDGRKSCIFTIYLRRRRHWKWNLPPRVI